MIECGEVFGNDRGSCLRYRRARRCNRYLWVGKYGYVWRTVL